MEELVKYYSDYQILKFKIENEKKDNILLYKDDKIDCLSKKIDHQSAQINKLLSEIGKSRYENGVIIDKLDNITETLDVVTDRYVPEGDDEEKNDIFILLRNPKKTDEKKYHAIRCQGSSI